MCPEIGAIRTSANPNFNMNAITCVKILGLGAALFPILSAQVLLTDDFSGGSIDSGKWSVILPGGSSSVVQSGGVLTTTARGILGSVTDFSAPYSISGSFTMLNSLEHFNIVFRSDLSGADSFERRGLFVSFSNEGDVISIQRYNNAGDTSILGQKSYFLTTGQSYSFSIIDDGLNVALSVNGSSELSGSSSYSTGNKIGFYSREFSSTATSLDSVTVTAVPEPATYAAILGFVTLGFVIFKRRSV